MINRPLIAYNTVNTFDGEVNILDLGFDSGAHGSIPLGWMLESGDLDSFKNWQYYYMDSGRGLQCGRIDATAAYDDYVISTAPDHLLIQQSKLRLNEKLGFVVWAEIAGALPGSPYFKLRIRSYDANKVLINTTTSASYTLTSSWQKVIVYYNITELDRYYRLSFLGNHGVDIDDGHFGKLLQFKSCSDLKPENIDSVQITQMAGGQENVRAFFRKKRASTTFKYVMPSQGADGIAGYKEIQQWYEDNIFQRQSFDFIFDRTDPSASKMRNLWNVRAEGAMKYSMPTGPERYEFNIEMVDITPKF
jgi:hypothetical protein